MKNRAILSLLITLASVAHPLSGQIQKNKLQYLVIHHTADSTPTSQLKKTNEYHRRRFGSLSSLGFFIGYNWFIDRNGDIIQTRKEGEETHAQKLYDHNSVSVCLAGNFENESPSIAQKNALKKLLRKYEHLTLRLHRDLGNTKCPGKNITKKWLKEIFAEDNRSLPKCPQAENPTANPFPQ